MFIYSGGDTELNQCSLPLTDGINALDIIISGVRVYVEPYMEQNVFVLTDDDHKNIIRCEV